MKSLTVWCGQEPPPRDLVNVVLWESFLPDDAPGTWRSLPEEINARREPLRQQYLEWLHALGLRKIRGKALRDQVLIRPTLSYWWMAVPATYSLDPNSPVYNAVRLSELERIAAEWQATGVRLAAPHDGPIGLIRAWARDTKRQLTVERFTADSRDRKPYSRAQRAKSALVAAFPPLGALAVLLGMGKQPGFTGPPPDGEAGPSTVMIDYLAHLGADESGRGAFASNYWGPLVDLVQQRNGTTWLHLSANRPTRPGLAQDRATIDSWAVPDHVRHDLLHSGATSRIKLRTARDYLRVTGMGLRTRRKRELFASDSARASLWPAFRQAYRDEWYGTTAMLNCLYLNLLEDYFARQPRADIGVYLFENQPWEMALIHAWRAAGHGRLVGFAHSTVLFWNTRPIKDARDIFPEQAPAAMPWPDAVAVNGPPMRALMERAGYSPDHLLDVEAVRYSKSSHAVPRQGEGAGTLLVLGEYSREATRRILELTKAAVESSGFTGQVVFRSHPAGACDEDTASEWYVLDSSPSATDAIASADFVVCGALSSAAVEALLLGRPTVLVADGQLLASSPAEALGPVWVNTPRDLERELANGVPGGQRPSSPAAVPYYFDAASLERWRLLLQRT